MFDFAAAIRTLDAMRADGVIAEYAIGGAMAFIYWDEPVTTQDVDVVLVVTAETHPLDPLRPVLDWLAAHEIHLQGEHAMIGGVPVQFMPAWDALVADAVSNAATVPYDDTDANAPTMRVVRPEYLIAMWEMDAAANSPRRRERAARLIEAGTATREAVDALKEKFKR